jgi:hypothetical protein
VEINKMAASSITERIGIALFPDTLFSAAILKLRGFEI